MTVLYSNRLYLNRKQAAHYVAERWGVPCSYKWLAKLAVVGGGPRHWKWGRAVRYRADALDAWVFSRMSGPFTSSSEAQISSQKLAALPCVEA